MSSKDVRIVSPVKLIYFGSTKLILSSLLSLALISIFSQTILAAPSPGFIVNTDLVLTHEDNIRRSSDTLKESDTILEVKPKAEWLVLFGKHQLDLHYNGDYGRYSDEDILNYSDHSLKAHGLFDHSYRFNSEFELGAARDHDDPGSTDAISATKTDFNEFKRDYAKGKFYYGTAKSIGQFILELNHSKTRYTNNGQSFRDNDQDTITGTFFYRIAPATRLLLESAFSEYDYLTGSFDQSSEDQRYLLGLEWKSTAKTTGIFKIGRQNKEYNNTIFDDITGLTLSLDMIWKQNTYTELKLGVTESAQASTGGFISEYIQAELKHQFTPRTAVSAAISLGDEEFTSSIGRSDKRKDFRIGLEHELRRWLFISTEIRYESRDSNQNQFDYSANIFMITISTKFD